MSNYELKLRDRMDMWMYRIPRRELIELSVAFDCYWNSPENSDNNVLSFAQQAGQDADITLERLLTVFPKVYLPCSSCSTPVHIPDKHKLFNLELQENGGWKFVGERAPKAILCEICQTAVPVPETQSDAVLDTNIQMEDKFQNEVKIPKEGGFSETGETDDIAPEGVPHSSANRSAKQGNLFGRIPQTVLCDRRLSANDKCVYAVLAMFTINKAARISAAKVAEELGMHEKTVHRCIVNLTWADHIDMKQRIIDGKTNKGQPARYAVPYYYMLSDVFKIKDKGLDNPPAE